MGRLSRPLCVRLLVDARSKRVGENVWSHALTGEERHTGRCWALYAEVSKASGAGNLIFIVYPSTLIALAELSSETLVEPDVEEEIRSYK